MQAVEDQSQNNIAPFFAMSNMYASNTMAQRNLGVLLDQRCS